MIPKVVWRDMSLGSTGKNTDRPTGPIRIVKQTRFEGVTIIQYRPVRPVVSRIIALLGRTR